MNYRTSYPKVGLALSGGAVRGFAHLGVLQVLVNAGIPIDYVAGTSVGSILGAMYCAGVSLEQMYEISTYINWSTLARPTLSRNGVLTFEKLEYWFDFIAGDLRFCDLHIPFAALTTDIETGESVAIREGRVATAVRASCSIPGLVTPVQIGDRFLVDGGISDNLPIDVVREMGADFVIGVDLMAPKVRDFAGPIGHSMFSLATLIQRSGGAPEQADYLIVPDVGKIRHLVSFRTGETLVELGRRAAEKSLPELAHALNL